MIVTDMIEQTRAFDQIRPIRMVYDAFGRTESSIIFELGNTKVLCALTLQAGVPFFLKGSRSGWLTADYSMAPFSTQVRHARDDVKKDGRSIEISRFIGRCLRAILDLSVLGEQTIVIDCLVLKADGGTRTACLTASYLLLERVVRRLLERGAFKQSPIKAPLAAISVGVIGTALYLDPSSEQDCRLDADFNVVLTHAGDIIEIQGTAEKAPLSTVIFDQVRTLAAKGIHDVIMACEKYHQSHNVMRHDSASSYLS
jgi:ribonuclease PH